MESKRARVHSAHPSTNRGSVGLDRTLSGPTLAGDKSRTDRDSGIASGAALGRSTASIVLAQQRDIPPAVDAATAFTCTGSGGMLFEAVLLRDYPMIRSTFLSVTLTVVAPNCAACPAMPVPDPFERVG